MRIWACLSLVFLALPTMAMTKVNLFEVEQVIEEQAEDSNIDAEELARRTAMQQVIFRATGDNAAINNDVIKKGVQRSSRFVSQMSVSTVDEQETLRVVFNSTQIQALLAQANIPFWPEERESVLIWVVEEEGYRRNIAWDQMAKPTMETIKALAEERGLPLIVPVGDIQDINGIESTSLWGDFREDIASASLRYSADAVLVVKIQGNNNKRVRWTLYDDNPQYITDKRLNAVTGESGGRINGALEDMVEELARFYANKRAQRHTGESTGSVNVQFEQLAGANTFFAVEKALLTLPSVTSVNVQRINADHVSFTLNLIGDPLDFEREISRISQIQALEHTYVEEEAEVLVTDSGDLTGTDDALQPVQLPEVNEGAEQAPTIDLQEPTVPATDSSETISQDPADLDLEQGNTVIVEEPPLVELYRFIWVD